jgi:mono/diheme cytochrome c family protein
MVGRNSIAVVAGLVVACGTGMSARPAYAIKQFFEEFKAVYVKPDSSDANEKALVAEVEAAKCNVCHMPASKKERNAYGEALAKLLDKKEDAKNVEKIRKALEEVAAMSSDAAKADAPKFGDLIKQGKLPGGAVVK